MDNISLMKRRELLRGLIDEWNANRLDLFEISQPDEVRSSFMIGHCFTTESSRPRHAKRQAVLNYLGVNVL